MRMHGHINVAENGLCLMNKMHRKIVEVCDGSKLGLFFLLSEKWSSIF